MVIGMENLESFHIDIDFPEKESERKELLEQILKISVGDLKTTKTPFYSMIFQIEDYPAITIRGPQYTFSLSSSEFSINVGEREFPAIDDIKEIDEIEFNEKFFNELQSDYNILIGTIIGGLKENIMDIELSMLLKCDKDIDYDKFFNSDFIANMYKSLPEGIVKIDGFRVHNEIKENEHSIQYRFWYDYEDKQSYMRNIISYKNDVSKINIIEIIHESINKIKQLLSIGW